MNVQVGDRVDRESTPRGDMIFVPGGAFRMGSDRHYPEEAPVHSVTVDGFRIGRTPVTNRLERRALDAGPIALAVYG
jgi:formylglycine-generating enzyme